MKPVALPDRHDLRVLGLLRFGTLDKGPVRLPESVEAVRELSREDKVLWLRGPLYTFVPCRMGRRCRVQVLADDGVRFLDHDHSDVGPEAVAAALGATPRTMCVALGLRLREGIRAGRSLWPWDRDDLRLLCEAAPDPGIACVVVGRLLGLWYEVGVADDLAWRLARVGVGPSDRSDWPDFELEEIASWAEVARDPAQARDLRSRRVAAEEHRSTIDSRPERPMPVTRGWPAGPWLGYPAIANNWTKSVAERNGCLVCWRLGVAHHKIRLCEACEDRYGLAEPGELLPGEHAQAWIRRLVGLDDGTDHQEFSGRRS